MPSCNTHREKIEKLRERLQKSEKILVINGVRVCCKPEFQIGEGSPGTTVYIGLDSDGDGKAVKRIPKTAVRDLSKNEKEILKSPNAVDSKNVLNYVCYDDKSNDDFAYLIVDLCEENLKEFVERQSAEELTRLAPDIIRQILQGLEDLHRSQPNHILHRNLKPPNILRCVSGTNVRWLLAGFGASRMVPKNASSLYSEQEGTPDWLSVDSYHDAEGTVVLDGGKVRYQKQSDIQVAGMVCFYILTKGEHAFGNVADRIRNLLDGKPVGLDQLADPSAKDLIGWMLQHKPADRPSAEEALKHPYLESSDLQFELLVCVANQPEVKAKLSTCNFARKLNRCEDSWKTQIRPDVLAYLSSDGTKEKRLKYDDEWTECLRLIRNVAMHWNDRPRPRPKVHYDVGEPKEYFLKIFPNLPVRVHRIVRNCPGWKERSRLKKFFCALEDERLKQLEAGPSDFKANQSGFAKRFLDPELHVLKKDVREKLKRFTWFGGSYGITGHNKQIPCAHLFVTVKRESFLKSDQVRDDIEREFGEGAFEFVELLQAPEKRPSIKFMLGREPAPGGGISVVRDVDRQTNPLQTSEQQAFVDEDVSISGRNASGTLMLFGVSDKRHYALSCYHVACDNDNVRFFDAFHDDPAQVFEQISSDAANECSVTRTRSFRYHHRENGQDEVADPNNNEGDEENGHIPRGANQMDDIFGKFSEGHFDTESDVVSIKLLDRLKVNCTISKANLHAEDHYIRKELENRNPILVEKDGYASQIGPGYLIAYDYFWEDDGRPLFERCYIVEGSHPEKPFLEPGDSGSLVSYYSNDNDDEKYAFAYGVCEVMNLALPDSSKESFVVFSDDEAESHCERGGKNYICLDLRTAKNKLGLENFCLGRCSLR